MIHHEILMFMHSSVKYPTNKLPPFASLSFCVPFLGFESKAKGEPASSDDLAKAMAASSVVDKGEEASTGPLGDAPDLTLGKEQGLKVRPRHKKNEFTVFRRYTSSFDREHIMCTDYSYAPTFAVFFNE